MGEKITKPSLEQVGTLKENQGKDSNMGNVTEQWYRTSAIELPVVIFLL